jgi:hypothetical protein
MIVTSKKPFEQIREFLPFDKKILVAGCSICAAHCKTGDEQAAAEMVRKLRVNGFLVAGSYIFDGPCQLAAIRQGFRDMGEIKFDIILSLACGTGTQMLGEYANVMAYPGVDTNFAGSVQVGPEIQEYCQLCGNCVLHLTGGLCPRSRCSKSLVNGPCGGTVDGKCDKDGVTPCGWAQIYERAKELGVELAIFSTYSPPKTFTHHPRQQIVKRDEGK